MSPLDPHHVSVLVRARLANMAGDVSRTPGVWITSEFEDLGHVYNIGTSNTKHRTPKPKGQGHVVRYQEFRSLGIVW
jgi:hypothetical protein